MKTIAIILAGSVINIAVWDAESAWDPISPGQCDTTVDITDRPTVACGDTYSGPQGSLATGGTFAAGAVAPPRPDPGGFLSAVFADSTLPTAFRLAIAPWLPILEANVGDPALIAEAWGALSIQYGLTTQQQATVAGYATVSAIPGL